MNKYNVQVFMSTYNGENYLRQQLDSILAQEGVNISILVRDDGSTDNTVSILNEYMLNGYIKFYSGINLGYAKSFFHLLANSHIEADYFSFSDQDDIWLQDKLINGINKMEDNGVKGIPLLYTSALQRVDENLNLLSMQNFKNLKLSVGSEFARHRLAGCTFIFNIKLYNMVKNAYFIDQLLCSHDEFTTFICLASGGKVIFDHKSYILFRRHRRNTSVDSIGFIKRVSREMQYFSLKKNEKSNLAKIILLNYNTILNNKELELVSLVANYKNDIDSMFKLLFSNKIDSGFWYYNLFLKILILLRFF